MYFMEKKKRLNFHWILRFRFLFSVILIFSLPGLLQSGFAGSSVTMRQETVDSRLAKYTDLQGLKATFGPTIPGLKDGWVPQGIAYAKDHGLFIFSHYHESRKYTALSAVDFKSQVLRIWALLNEPNGNPHRGKAGGVTIQGDLIYLSSSKQLLRFDLREFLGTPAGESLRAHSADQADNNSSFCNDADGIIWLGEFARYRLLGKKFKTHKNHHMKDRADVKKRAVVYGYAPEDMKTPRFALSIRQEIQGICITDNFIYLSKSYGRRNLSLLVKYDNPLAEAPHDTIPISGDSPHEQREIPLWFLDGKNYKNDFELPPMAEGIEIIGGKLHVVFESAAKKFLEGGKAPNDRVLVLENP